MTTGPPLWVAQWLSQRGSYRSAAATGAQRQWLVATVYRSVVLTKSQWLQRRSKLLWYSGYRSVLNCCGGVAIQKRQALPWRSGFSCAAIRLENYRDFREGTNRVAVNCCGVNLPQEATSERPETKRQELPLSVIYRVRESIQRFI